MSISLANSVTSPLETQFERAFNGSTMRGQSAPWVQSARADAMRNFVASGLPHRRQEAWKYTDLRKWLQDNYRLIAARAGSATVEGAEVINLKDALDAPGLWLRTLFEPSKNAIGNLNAALADDGALIRVPRGVALLNPLMVHHDGADDGEMTHARNLIQLEPGSSATLIETIRMTGNGLSTSHMRIDVQEGASLNHIRLIETDAGANWLGDDAIQIDADARYALTLVQAGQGLSRNDSFINLIGTRAAAHLSAATIGVGAGHFDWNLALKHRAPDTKSRLWARTVLGGKSFCAIQGCVSVAQNAQHSDSHQLTKALLLSDRAQVVHKPELEIFADDVKCGHGATTGALNTDHLFYLRARGIPEVQARTILVEAFLAEIADAHHDATIRTLIDDAIARSLKQLNEAAA